MTQNKAAPSSLNIKKTLFFIALATAAIVLLLKVIKETTRVPEALPLISPLPDSATLAVERTEAGQKTDESSTD